MAYVRPADASTEVSELRRFLKERLPTHMVPSTFVFVDEFPLTANGKIDRKALPSPQSRSPGTGKFICWTADADGKRTGPHLV